MITIDAAIKAYIKLRNQEKDLKAKHKEELDPIGRNMAKLEAFILQQAQAQNVKSFRTDYGTAFLSTKDSATVADWDSLFKFIMENEAFDMLEKRVSKLAVRSHLDTHNELPPGVNYSTSLEVTVRSPSKTAKE